MGDLLFTALSRDRKRNARVGGGLAFLVAYLFYAFVWVRQGLNPEDGGYLVGLSWRVVTGEIPFRDFLSKQPPFSIYLHALPIAGGPYALFVDRLFSLGQIAVTAIVGTRVLLNVAGREEEDGNFWPVALAAFVLTAHNWPAFGWMTVDGVFFAALSLWAATARRFGVAGVLAVSATMCKQNFLAFAVFGLVLALLHGRSAALRYGLGCLGVILPLFAWLSSVGALGPMLHQSLSAGHLPEIWDAGVTAYVDHILDERNLLALGAALVLGFVVWQRKGLLPAALTYGYLGYALLALVAFASRVLDEAFAGAQYDYMMVEFEESSSMLIVAGCLTLVWMSSQLASRDRQTHCATLARFGVLAGLFVIAWTASISRGYQIPAMFSVPLLAPLVLWGPPAVPRPPVRLLTCVGLAVFGIAYAFPYGESLRMDKLVSVPVRFHGAAMIRTSPLHVEKLNAIAEWSDRNPNVPMIVLPIYTPASFLLQRPAAAPLDWVADTEIPADMRDRVVSEICERRSPVLVERSVAERVLASKGTPWASRVLERVVAEWTLRERGEYFDLYVPPAAC